MLATRLAERALLPDSIIRAGIRRVVTENERRHAAPVDDAVFAREMGEYPIAIFSDAANSQHYELPAAFFATFLGPRRKYSSCFYPTGDESLAAAENCALATTVERAQIADGLDILELGCGWGSLSLYMAERYPAARIIAVSNSHSQRSYIELKARTLGIQNLKVMTADMNDFGTELRFDRIMSLEMFEHIANWRALLARSRMWLRPGGTLFLHVFAHQSRASRYDVCDREDWMAQHFFSGGIMPSRSLIHQFADIFEIEQEWRWNGNHYRRTALDWLRNFDANRDALNGILHRIYGDDAALWRQRWRMFFLAVAESFGFDNGNAWGVSHYRLKPTQYCYSA